MKKVIYQTISLLMALLLLLSTISWKVEKHYCMGRLMNVALFVDVADCGMNMVYDGIDSDQVETEDSCCDDEVVFVEGQDDLPFELNDLTAGQQQFLLAFSYSIKYLFNAQTAHSVVNEQYPPPNLVKDIQLLDEVFLI